MSDARILDDASWKGLSPAETADIYFTHDYHRISAIGEGGAPRCFAVEHGEGRLLVPGLLRPAAPELLADALDLQTCNGYGGPLVIASTPPSHAALQSMWSSVSALAAREGVVAAFFRLHPLLDNERGLPDGAEIRSDRQTVYVDTRLPVETLWGRASVRYRRLVRKADRMGVGVRWNSPDDWEDFPDFYEAAMVRLDARASLRFPKSYFASLASTGFAEIGAVRNGARMQSAVILLHGSRWSHYHLACRAPDADVCIGSAILDACVARTRLRGLDGLHLGGGRTPANDDTLLAFKKSTGGDLLDYRVARVVFDEERFARLQAAWTARTGREGSWLLPYREPIAEVRR